MFDHPSSFIHLPSCCVVSSPSSSQLIFWPSSLLCVPLSLSSCCHHQHNTTATLTSPGNKMPRSLTFDHLPGVVCDDKDSEKRRGKGFDCCFQSHDQRPQSTNPGDRSHQRKRDTRRDPRPHNTNKKGRRGKREKENKVVFSQTLEESFMV